MISSAPRNNSGDEQNNNDNSNKSSYNRKKFRKLTLNDKAAIIRKLQEANALNGNIPGSLSAAIAADNDITVRSLQRVVKEYKSELGDDPSRLPSEDPIVSLTPKRLLKRQRASDLQEHTGITSIALLQAAYVEKYAAPYSRRAIYYALEKPHQTQDFSEENDAGDEIAPVLLSSPQAAEVDANPISSHFFSWLFRK